MIAKTSQSGHTTYGLQDFTIDTPEDVNQLPLDIPMGSTALCLKPLAVFVLNGNKEWVDILNSSNEEQSAGDGTSDTEEENGGGDAGQSDSENEDIDENDPYTPDNGEEPLEDIDNNFDKEF